MYLGTKKKRTYGEASRFILHWYCHGRPFPQKMFGWENKNECRILGDRTFRKIKRE
jgi:hypothetical protein